jgi:LCP family protein required for cell wall assembly
MDNQIKSTKILLYGVVCALLISMVGLGTAIKKMNTEISEKDLQLSVLADEIGELKEENLYMHEDLMINRDFLLNSFDLLYKSFNDYEKSNEEKTDELNSTFVQVQGEMDKMVGERDLAIKNLKVRNDSLAQELSFQDYDSDIEHILILGKNNTLADTILLASINPSKETITLVSIPRDLYINGRKINSILATYGIEKFKKDIYTVTGIYANKHVILEFESFKKMIDTLGGIDLYVKEDIYDDKFPNNSNGYTVYSIEEGSHHMDGEEALKYARSRKSTSDFDRSKRQQQVIQSIRAKLQILNILRDIDKAKELFTLVVDGIKTNIGVFDALAYMNKFQNFTIESGNVISNQNFLYGSRSLSGQYILLPNSGSYYEIKKYISQLIKE